MYEIKTKTNLVSVKAGQEIMKDPAIENILKSRFIPNLNKLVKTICDKYGLQVECTTTFKWIDK